MLRYTFSSIVLSLLISLYVTWFRLLKPAAMAKADSFGILEDNILYGILLAYLHDIFFVV